MEVESGLSEGVDGMLPHEALDLARPHPQEGSSDGAALLPPPPPSLLRAASYTGSVARSRSGSAAAGGIRAGIAEEDDEEDDAPPLSDEDGPPAVSNGGRNSGNAGEEASCASAADAAMDIDEPATEATADAPRTTVTVRRPDGSEATLTLTREPSPAFLPRGAVAVILPHTPGPAVPIDSESSRVDVVGMEAALTAVLSGRSPEVLSEALRASAAVLDEMKPAVKGPTSRDALRAFLPILLSPTNGRPAHSAANLARACACILGLPQSSRDTLVEWLGNDVPPTLFRSRLVRPFIAHVDYHLKLAIGGNPHGQVATSKVSGAAPVPGGAAGSGRVVSLTHLTSLEVLVRVLRLLHNLNDRLAVEADAALNLPPSQRSPRAQAAIEAERRASLYGTVDPQAVPGAPLGALLPPEEFCSPGVSSLPDDVLLMDLSRWRKAGYKRSLVTPLVLLMYPFLLDASAKRRVMLLDNTLTMQSEAQTAVARSLMGQPGEAPFLVLHVRRSHVLSDTLNQLLAQPQNIRKQLRVSFHGEEALDAGGVTKE